MALSADQQKRVAYLVEKGEDFEAQVAKLENYLKGSGSDTPNPVNAKLRLDNLPSYKEALRYNKELKKLDPQNPQVELFLDAESRYFNVATAVSDIQKPAPIANSTLNASSINVTEDLTLPRLPEVKIPTFDGNQRDWNHFKNQFLSFVHQRPNASDALKSTQLFSALSGQALEKVKALKSDEKYYEKAWETLLKFYDRKRVVVSHHLNAILDLPVLTNATVDGLSSLVDTARQHLHILESHKERPSDQIVVRIIERCLPLATTNRWRDKLDMDELPKLEDLFDFIQNTIFKLQAQSVESSSEHRNRKRAADNVSQSRSKNAKQSARSFVTTATPSAPSTSSSSFVPPSCPKCKAAHRLYKCQDFNNLSIQERWKFVNAQKICRNCLGTHSFPCTSEHRCKRCSRVHHSLLHQDKKERNSGSKQAKSHESKSKDDKSSSANSQT